MVSLVWCVLAHPQSCHPLCQIRTWRKSYVGDCIDRRHSTILKYNNLLKNLKNRNKINQQKTEDRRQKSIPGNIKENPLITGVCRKGRSFLLRWVFHLWTCLKGMPALSGSFEQVTSRTLPTPRSYNVPGSLELTHNDVSSNLLSLVSISFKLTQD